MKLIDIIRMCFHNLLKRKVRTLLPVFGVMVGTCAVVVMFSLGEGKKESNRIMMESMTDLTVININNYAFGPDAPVLDEKVIAKIRTIDGVKAVLPYDESVGEVARLKGGKYVAGVWISAVSFQDLQYFGVKLEDGELPEKLDPESLLISRNALYSFYNPKKKNRDMISPVPDANGNLPKPYVDPMKDKLELVVLNQKDNGTDEAENLEKGKAIRTDCAGILAEEYSSTIRTSYAVYVDISMAKKLREEYNKLNKVKDNANTKKGYQTVYVKVDSMEQVSGVEEAIHGLGFTDTYSSESDRKSMEEDVKRNQVLWGGVGAISLFVAALGIVNTMIMAIYERTREIGIMKVLGCMVGNIRTLFLMEAGMIGLIGGLAGLGLSYAISFGINTLAASGKLEGAASGMTQLADGTSVMLQYSIIPPWLAVGAVILAIFIGLISGFSPANRAVKISALTAIKQE